MHFRDPHPCNTVAGARCRCEGLRPTVRMLTKASRTGEIGLTDRRHMTKQAPVTGFSPGERNYIRRELDMFFSTLPTVAEGFQLKTWRGGP